MSNVMNVSNNKVIQNLVQQIREGKVVDFFEVPENLQNHPEIIKIERKKGIRRIDSCGYDVIRNNFYVVESVVSYNDYGLSGVKKVEREHFSVIDSFDTFFDFIDGDIYNVNCLFYMYVFSREEILKYNINVERIHRNETCDENYSNILPEELKIGDEGYTKEEILEWEEEWISKFRSCISGEELCELTEQYQNTKKLVDVQYFLWDYMHFYGQDSFDAIMDFVATETYPAYTLKNVIGFIYGIDSVKERYECRDESYAISTRRHKKSKLRAFYTQCLESGIEERIKGYFSHKTQNYVISTELIYKSGRNKGLVAATLYYFFRDFNEFTEKLNNNISGCDLTFSDAYDIDWDAYVYSETTLFPLKTLNELEKSFEARYDSKIDRFNIVVYWKDSRGNVVFCEKRRFKYLHQLCNFFDNDLSNIDLATCNGLLSVPSFEGINIENAMLCPELMEKLGIEQEEAYKYDVVSFTDPICNEAETGLVLYDKRPAIPYDELDDERNIAYISDIHIVHKICNLKTRNEQFFALRKIIEGLFEESEPGILLIAGDISSDFDIFVRFIKLLRQYIDNHSTYTRVVFVLGNHELWPFKGLKMEQIVDKYRQVLSEQGMYLIHNEILCFEYGRQFIISEDELLEASAFDLRNKVLRANIVILGGNGFSGCNKEFNADNGIYRDVISREEEIKQTEKFKLIYDKITEILSDKRIIVLTHTSVPDWNGTYDLCDNYVYVNGHNHKNFFYHEGLQRVYADNQIGYGLNIPRLKYFSINDTYDIFSEHEDGIHEISRRDYQDFYHGINGYVTFNRRFNKLYLLKKKGYYCFIMRSFSDRLYILNGGSIEKLQCNVIEYYYDNMDFQIAKIKNPLSRYKKIQEKISAEVKSFGGSGKIHGAIVDIDFFCHLYVNPLDMKVTPYYATDIVNKYAYMNVPSLLKNRSPELFVNYEKLIADKLSKTAMVVYSFSEMDIQNKTVPYESTDIYKVSRKLKQMQKLNHNILSTWTQDIKGMPVLPRNIDKNEGVGSVCVGMTLMMNCGMEATVIEDFGYKNITIQFEDGVIRKHRAKDKFLNGKIAHRYDKSET